MQSKIFTIGLLQLVYFYPSIPVCVADLLSMVSPKSLKTPSSSAEKTALKLMSMRFGLALNQKKVVVDGSYMAWYSGFRTRYGEKIYGCALERNQAYGTQRWTFIGWLTERDLKERRLRIPGEVQFFKDGKAPKYRVDIGLNLAASFHLVERRTRLSGFYGSMDGKTFKQVLLKALEAMRFALNNGKITASPIFNENLGGQLVVPLCMSGCYTPGSKADAAVVLALAMDDGGSPYYYCSTILTRDMTFYDARLVSTIPEESWIRTGVLERRCA